MNTTDFTLELEKTRKKSSLITAIILVPILTAIIILTIICIVASNKGWESSETLINVTGFFGFFSLFVSLYVVFTIRARSYKKYRKLYKSSFVQSTLASKFDEMFYNGEGGLDKQQVTSFNLCKMGNQFTSEDYLYGVYNGITFKQADVTIEHDASITLSENGLSLSLGNISIGNANSLNSTRSTNSKESEKIVFFKGRMCVFDFPGKNVAGIQVYSKNYLFAASKPDGYSTERVKLESAHFNEVFTVKTIDEHEAFYLLTPQIIEQLEQLQYEYPELTMYFSKNKLYVGIMNISDTFEPPANLKKIDYALQRKRILNDVKPITTIIDTIIKPQAINPVE